MSVSFPFNSDQKSRWSNFPPGIYPRNGLRLGDLSAAQRTAVFELLATALSQCGLQKVKEIMEGDEVLKDKVNSLALQGRRRIILNLAEVPYIDSAGLGGVVSTYTTISRQGGQLKLVNLTKRITDLLSITKLLTVFETFDSEAEAIKSFS